MSSQARSLRRRLLAKSTRCCFCKRRLTPATTTLEHIVPKSEGGTLRKGNVVLSCKGCNHERGSEDFDAFMAKKRAVIKATTGGER